MDFESLVMYFLASEGYFLSPQFSIGVGRSDWSCPDFVALDFTKKRVVVVEVTTAYDVSSLVEKIYNRDQQWFQRLRQILLSRKVVTPEWSFAVRAFVRADRLEYTRAKFTDIPDVTITDIESIAFSWKWPWDDWKSQRENEY